MPDDKTATLRQADSLYQGFPDFSAWSAPAEDDLELWDHFAARLEETRTKAAPETLGKAVEVALRAAAMDTGAIEGLYSVDRGFTMTVATQALAWEHALEEKGEEVRRLFEAQLEAYELVIDAVTNRLPITEAWIRALHEKVCAEQPTYKALTDQGWQEHELPKGTYKTQPNHVLLKDGSIHPYAPVDQVAPEMHRLLEQIRTPEFESAHPITQASYLHYGLVAIHPFADGNGRVARALASVFFYRALSIPFLVFANQKTAYLSVLHQADQGGIQPLLAFFRDRGIDTIQLVIDHLLTAEAPALESIAARLRLVDEVGLRLLHIAREQIETQFETLELPRGFIVEIEATDDTFFDHPKIMGVASLFVTIKDFELSFTSQTIISARISHDIGDQFPIRLIDSKATDDQVEARFEDAHPEISESLRLRLENWCSRVLGRMLKELKSRSHTAQQSK